MIKNIMTLYRGQVNVTYFPCKSKIPSVKGWKTYAGPYDKEGCFGIVVMDGFIVIDLDSYKNPNLKEKVFKRLGIDELEAEMALLQTTPRGGEHYLFELPEEVEITQGSDLLGITGFDIKAAGKGYIRSGEGYTVHRDLEEGLRDGLFPPLPQSAIEVLQADRKPVKEEIEESTDLLKFTLKQPLDGITLEDAEGYLAQLPDEYAEDRNKWLKVGMAIKHQFGEEGEGLFNTFSQRGSSYDSERFQVDWDSFNSDGDKLTTFKSVIKWANENTVKGIGDQIEKAGSLAGSLEELEQCQKELAKLHLSEFDLSQHLRSLQKKFKKFSGKSPSITSLEKKHKRLVNKHRNRDVDGGFVDDYVYMTATKEYFHKESKTVMSAQSFDVKHTRETPPDSEGDPQSAVRFVNSRIEVVENSMYNPVEGDVFEHDGLRYVNLYKPHIIDDEPDPLSDIADRLKGHIAHLLPDEREQQIMINFLAHQVQFPGKKIPWAIILQGVQGDGKSLLGEMMQLVLGHSNVRVMNAQTLETPFNAWVMGQCLNIIEEVKIGNYHKHDILNRLKPTISNKYVEVTKKGHDPRVVLNTSNYLAFTNYRDALPIDDSDRRYCIFTSQWQSAKALIGFRTKNPGYYHDLYEDMRGGVVELYHWLKDHKIPDSFMKQDRAPETQARLDMINLSKSHEQQLIEQAIEDFNCEDINENFINVTSMNKKVGAARINDESYNEFPQGRGLNKTLITMGFIKIDRKKMKGEVCNLYRREQ